MPNTNSSTDTTGILGSILVNNNKTMFTTYGSLGKSVTASGTPAPSGIQQIDVNTGLVTQINSFINQGTRGVLPSNGNVVTEIGDYDMNLAHNGTILVGVETIGPNKIARQGSTIIETDGVNITNDWDFVDIITNAFIAGGDGNVIGNFIGDSSDPDWSHENSAIYNPKDNTLIISSREHFIMAVDYNYPTDGKKRYIGYLAIPQRLGISINLLTNLPYCVMEVLARPMVSTRYLLIRKVIL